MPARPARISSSHRKTWDGRRDVDETNRALGTIRQWGFAYGRLHLGANQSVANGATVVVKFDVAGPKHDTTIIVGADARIKIDTAGVYMVSFMARFGTNVATGVVMTATTRVNEAGVWEGQTIKNLTLQTSCLHDMKAGDIVDVTVSHTDTTSGNLIGSGPPWKTALSVYMVGQ